MIKAVLTGDLINSQSINARVKQALYTRFSNYINELSKEKGFEGEVNRGDWFQCVIHKPEMALRYALKIKFYLRTFALLQRVSAVNKLLGQSPIIIPKPIIDARVAIGIGEIEFVNRRLGTSDGEAFQLSGRLLDTMKSQRNGLNADISKNDLREQIQTVLILADTIIQKTTPPQCQVMFHKLHGLTETEIARKLKIKQSAVNQRSTSGGWRAIENAVNYYETLIKQHI